MSTNKKLILSLLIIQCALSITNLAQPESLQEPTNCTQAVQGLGFGFGHGIIIPPLSVVKSLADTIKSIYHDLEITSTNKNKSYIAGTARGTLAFFIALYFAINSNSKVGIAISFPPFIFNLARTLLGYTTFTSEDSSEYLHDAFLSIMDAILVPLITLFHAVIAAGGSILGEFEDMIKKTQQLVNRLDHSMQKTYIAGSALSMIFWYMNLYRAIMHHSTKSMIITTPGSILTLAMTLSALAALNS